MSPAMNGARMRWNSEAGTRPCATSDSVPRLIAPWRARTRTAPAGQRCPAARRGFPRGPRRHVPQRPGRLGARSPQGVLIPQGASFTLSWVSIGAHVLTDRRVLCRRLAVPRPGDGIDRRAAGAGRPHALARRLRCRSISVLLVLFALTTPWIAVGFWNAAIGFIIMRFADDPVQRRRAASGAPIRGSRDHASTAIVMCVRNEAPDRVDPQPRHHDGRDRGREAVPHASMSTC